ncbi:MAG: flagellar hook-basal body complex protein, partial [Candidatus Methylumidiphilus sp.]
MTDLSVTAGLNIAQSTLNTIASNVANVSTPGYKAGAYSFLATLSSSSDSVLSDPSSGIIQQFKQGSIASTGNSMNAAINGLGFFRVAGSSGEASYTRNGEFAIGSNGALQLVNGSHVTGYMADSAGKILPTLTTISLDQTPLPPSATT